MVTIRPPATMPLAKSRGANRSPASPARQSRIQLPHKTDLSMRCWISICSPAVHWLFTVAVDFFDGQQDVVESRDNAENQENKHQPWGGAEDLVQKEPDKQSDKHREGNGEPEGTVPAQLPHHLPGFFFHVPPMGSISLLKVCYLP